MGINLERTAAQALADRVGGSVNEGDVDRRGIGSLAVAELEKLSLYRLDGPVTADDVAALVPDAVPSSVFGFLDAVANRNVSRAAQLLDRLLDSTAEPIILTQLHRRIREVLVAKDFPGGRSANADLVKALGVHPYVAEKAVAASARWTVTELEDALEGVQELDAAVKGVEGSYGSDRQRRLRFASWLHAHVAPGPGPGDRGEPGGGRNFGDRTGAGG
jgi:DNA polymerase III delta subunit